MITDVHLEHFKCFEKLDLPLGQLTVLTGLNSAGKSSVIQSLLLVHQTVIDNEEAARLRLNGNSVSLGTYGDVLDKQSGRDHFSIGVSCDDHRFDWFFASSDKSEVLAELSYSEIDGERINSSDYGILPDDGIIIDGELLDHGLLNLLGGAVEAIKRTLHVATERIGPRETYQADDSEEAGTRLGPRGEFTAWFLHRNEDRQVSAGLCLPDVSPLLARQAEAWLGHFFPGAAFQVQRIKGTRLVSLRFRSSSSDEFYRPENVGYGLSHLLPVIVGGLGAGENQLFIVENPEAHLHPSAQAEIGQFLAKVAASGAQVLVETHSDHVLNGIRRAVRSEILGHEETKIHFFQKRGKNVDQVISPQIDSAGSLDNWPKGFFDQYEKDLNELTDW